MGGTVNILAWNILHGGGPRRTPGIVLALLDSAADVIVLSEFRPTMGGQIRGVLGDHGYRWHAVSPLEAGCNSMLIASRLPGSPLAVDLPEPRRGAAMCLDSGMIVSAVHIPDARRHDHAAMGRKSAFWRALLDHARLHQQAEHVIIGDFNTGRHRADETGRSFSSTALLGELTAMGYRDGYRLVRPTGRAFSWESHTGGRYRLDQVFVSQRLCTRVSEVRYSQVERRAGLSDHAPMTVKFAGFCDIFEESAFQAQKAGVLDLPGR
jgi:exonuclease III